MTFRKIVGHHRLIGLVGRAIAADSLPPSLILSGPDGVGKRQFALAVAQSLNCVDPVTDPATGLRDACGRCVACGKIVRGNHADVLLVGPDDGGSIKIDVIRQLVGQTAYRPFEGRTRIVIVDQADQMGEDSQNALLKTLEEPPSRNAFILVTSHPDLLLPTIRSRCCQLRFGPLAPAEIASALRNQHGYAERDAKAAAALAHGSLRRALDLGAAATSDDRGVAAAVLHEVATSADPRVRLAAGAALLVGPNKKGKDREGKTPSGADRGLVAARLRAMGALLRDVTILTIRAPETALVNLDLRAELEPLASVYDRPRLERAFSAVGRALGALERNNASPKIVVDWLAFQL